MNTQRLLTRTIVIFATLAIVGIGMAVGARSLANLFDQAVMIAVGAAIFCASLTFFLVRVFSLPENK